MSGTCVRELNYGGDVQIICVCLSERPGSVTKRRQNAKKCGGALQVAIISTALFRRFGVPKFCWQRECPNGVRKEERSDRPTVVQLSFVDIFNGLVFITFTVCYAYQLYYVLVVLTPQAEKD